MCESYLLDEVFELFPNTCLLLRVAKGQCVLFSLCLKVFFSVLSDYLFDGECENVMKCIGGSECQNGFHLSAKYIEKEDAKTKKL